MHKIHSNPQNIKSPLNTNEDQVLSSFYQQRKKRANSTGRHHSLLQKNSSFFSKANDKGNNESRNDLNFSQFAESSNNNEIKNNNVVSSLNVDLKIASIKDKIMKDMNKDALANNIMKKYSIGQTFIDNNNNLTNNYVRFQSQKTTPKNISNENKVQLLQANYQRQNDKGVQGIQKLQLGQSMINKQSRRQRHLDQLQRSFMSLTSPKHSITPTEIPINNVNDSMIISKLSKYVNRNKQNINSINSNQQNKNNSNLSQNINIVNKLKQSKKSGVQIRSVISQQNQMKRQNQRQSLIHKKVAIMEQMKSQHEIALQHLRKQHQRKQKYSLIMSKQQQMPRYKNLYHAGTDHEEQFHSPSFKMNHNSEESIERKCKIDSLINQYDEAVKNQRKTNLNCINDDQLSLAKRQEQNMSKKYINLQCQHKKASQENQLLLKRIEQLQIINKKQSKFIQSVFGMRRTIQKTDNDCSLKQLWRWVKTLPMRA